jgi:hypothetical protein
LRLGRPRITQAVANLFYIRLLWRHEGKPIAANRRTGLSNEAVTDGHTRTDFHALAQEAELIVGSDRQAYEALIAKLFQGRTSSKDLNENEISILTTHLRGIKYEKQLMK